MHAMDSMVVCYRYLLKAVGLGFPIFHGTGMMVASVGLLPYQAMHTALLSPVRGFCSA